MDGIGESVLTSCNGIDTETDDDHEIYTYTGA